MRNRHILNLFIAIIITGMLSLGCGSLTRSAVRNDLDGVKKYLAKGEDVNKFDRYGWTPLLWAVYYNYPDMVKYLLEQKADPNAKTLFRYGTICKNSTPLIIASYYGYEDIVALLLKYGANVNDVDCNGENAYAIAKKYNFITIMFLLSKGTDKNLLAILEELKKKESEKIESENKKMYDAAGHEKYRAVKDPTGWLALGLGISSGMGFILACDAYLYPLGHFIFVDGIYLWDYLPDKRAYLYEWYRLRKDKRAAVHRRNDRYYVSAGIGGAAMVMLATFIGRNIDAIIKEKKTEKSGDVSLIFPTDFYDPVVLPNQKQLHFGMGLSMKF